MAKLNTGEIKNKLGPELQNALNASGISIPVEKLNELASKISEPIVEQSAQQAQNILDQANLGAPSPAFEQTMPATGQEDPTQDRSRKKEPTPVKQEKTFDPSVGAQSGGFPEREDDKEDDLASDTDEYEEPDIPRQDRRKNAPPTADRSGRQKTKTPGLQPETEQPSPETQQEKPFRPFDLDEQGGVAGGTVAPRQKKGEKKKEDTAKPQSQTAQEQDQKRAKEFQKQRATAQKRKKDQETKKREESEDESKQSWTGSSLGIFENFFTYLVALLVLDIFFIIGLVLVVILIGSLITSLILLLKILVLVFFFARHIKRDPITFPAFLAKELGAFWEVYGICALISTGFTFVGLQARYTTFVRTGPGRKLAKEQKEIKKVAGKKRKTKRKSNQTTSRVK